MSEIKSEFEFILNKSISYMKDGEMVESKSLILKAPSRNNDRIITKLKQSFFRGMWSLQKGNLATDATQKISEKNEISGQEIITMLFMSDIDMNKFKDIFKELILSDICFINENQKLTKSISETIEYNDLERLLGEYLENFMTSSWLSMTTTK